MYLSPTFQEQQGFENTLEMAIIREVVGDAGWRYIGIGRGGWVRAAVVIGPGQYCTMKTGNVGLHAQTSSSGIISFAQPPHRRIILKCREFQHLRLATLRRFLQLKRTLNLAQCSETTLTTASFVTRIFAGNRVSLCRR
jgi:hypothetical protein